MRQLLVVVASALLAGCASGEQVLVVESDAPWSGTITIGQHVTEASGTSNRWEFLLLGESACWEFRKNAGPGALRAYAAQSGAVEPERVGLDEATGPNARVSGCS